LALRRYFFVEEVFFVPAFFFWLMDGTSLPGIGQDRSTASPRSTRR